MNNGKWINGLIVFFIISIPLLLFFNIKQGYKYERVNAEIKNYEYEQKEWFEDNKRMLSVFSVYSSPSRVKQIADKNPDLEMQKQGQAVILQFGEDESGEIMGEGE